MVLKAVMQGW